ncbi:hypothetical protein NUW58_g7269 [Xylaria curta]|uniref:Uncharacterized protein n=1 Tax=Xylaria curta TaxID=42375 RepID=A0ACC1NJR5_9PEZI|nr:hypothetical protein NUW58_g7269 [Xylaria curta]
MHHAACVHGCKSQDLAKASENNQTPVVAAVSRDNGAADGNTDKTSDRDDGPAYADGRDRDVVAGRKPKEDGKDHEPGSRLAERQPHNEARKDSDADRDHVRIERADSISPPPRQGPAKHRRSVQNRQYLEGKGFAEAVSEGVARDVRQGDEQAELEKEDADGQEQKRLLLEDAEVRVDADVLGGGEPLLQKDVGDNKQAQTQEPEGPDRPAPAYAAEQGRRPCWRCRTRTRGARGRSGLPP